MTAAVISAYEYNLPGLVLLTCHSIVTREAWIVKIPILDSRITDGAGKLGLTLRIWIRNQRGAKQLKPPTEILAHTVFFPM